MRRDKTRVSDAWKGAVPDRSPGRARYLQIEPTGSQNDTPGAPKFQGDRHSSEDVAAS